MENLSAEELAVNVSKMLNSFGDNNSKEFINVILNDHPTLQQKFMSEIVIRFIRDFSKKTYVDGRNEMTKIACDKLIHVLKEMDYDVGLPMI